MSQQAVDVAHVTVAYGERVALEDVTFKVGAGRLVGVIGPNGAGKSTLFRALLGIVPLRAGTIRVFGEPPEVARRAIAYVPQREEVDWSFPITVEEVVLLGCYRRVGWLRRPGPLERAAAISALEQVGLADRARSQIGRLSGGQQQRVFIARALLQLGEGLPVAASNGPRLMLLDEPLAGVDASSAEVVLSLLRRLADSGHTVLMATHDLNVAAATCDLLLLLNRTVAGYGPPEEVFTREVLARTYGGHALVFSTPALAFGVPDDGTHHAHGHGPGDKGRVRSRSPGR